MILIIAEKNLAGERIAQILGGKTTRLQTKGFAKYYSFSRNNEEYVTLPLRGHIVEVDFPKQYASWMGTDLQQLIDAPILYLPNDPAIANLLREMGKLSHKVIIATDADREGESIGVEALRILQETNPSVPTARAYFSAMTPKELVKSFDELVKVDHNLSDSADSRREIDLVWGAALTRFVSIMSNRMGKEFISVGRVQTPVLALIVNREKERLAFVVQPYWEIIAECEKNAQTFEAFHKGGKIFDEKVAQTIFEKVKGAKLAKVMKVTTKKKSIARPIPFDTTQLLRSASALGLAAGQAMNVAESLYMGGFISYPRTDNTVYPDPLDLRELLSELGNFPAYKKFVDEILAKPLNPSRGTKNTTDHPPVHPTKVPDKNSIGEKEWKLFDLVARRFLATFLPDALTENTSVELDIHTEPFIATGQTILSPGWKAAYP
ncbi:MAG: DNA topoisomerase, partial [archaeon]